MHHLDDLEKVLGRERIAEIRQCVLEVLQKVVETPEKYTLKPVPDSADASTPDDKALSAESP
jgi:hypothetical protein